MPLMESKQTNVRSATHLLRLHVKRRSAKTRQPVLTSFYRSVYMSEVIQVWQTRRWTSTVQASEKRVACSVARLGYKSQIGLLL